MLIPAANEAVKLNTQDPVALARHSLKRLHLSGLGKQDGGKLGHLRLGHVHQDATNFRLGFPMTRNWACHACRIFKAKYPVLTPLTDTPKLPPDSAQDPILSDDKLVNLEQQDASKKLGDCVHLDVWGPYKVKGETMPAAATQWTHIIGAVDAGVKVINAQGCTEPNGTIAARFLRAVIVLYKTVYKVALRCVRFDNARYFDCSEVVDVCTEFKVRITFTVPYLHHQLLMERYWGPMARNAACLLAFAQRPKNLYVHACLHALKLLNIVLFNKGQSIYVVFSKRQERRSI